MRPQLLAGTSRPTLVALSGVSIIGLACTACGASTTGPTEKVSDRPAAFTATAPGTKSDPITDFYGYSGKEQTVKAPAGATSVEITLVGGKGGDSNGLGGKPQSITATWPASSTSTLVLDIGGAGTKGSAGWSGAGAGGGKPGCKDAGGGGGATVITLNGNVIAVAGGSGGGGYHGASVLTDFGGVGAGPLQQSTNGSGPGHGTAGASGSGGSLQVGGDGSNGKNLGGCAGAGGGGLGAGSGGTGGGAGGGGGGGGGAGGSYVTGASDAPVYSSDIGYGTAGNGLVRVTWLPQ